MLVKSKHEYKKAAKNAKWVGKVDTCLLAANKKLEEFLKYLEQIVW